MSHPEKAHQSKTNLTELSNGRNLRKLQFLVSISVCPIAALRETERDETFYSNFFTADCPIKSSKERVRPPLFMTRRLIRSGAPAEKFKGHLFVPQFGSQDP